MSPMGDRGSPVRVRASLTRKGSASPSVASNLVAVPLPGFPGSARACGEENFWVKISSALGAHSNPEQTFTNPPCNLSVLESILSR